MFYKTKISWNSKTASQVMALPVGRGPEGVVPSQTGHSIFQAFLLSTSANYLSYESEKHAYL